jgi:3-oxoacyl-[acyl-carrier protein] reductase
MDLGLTNRVALVTGAGRNIGRAIALALAGEGARVIMVSRSRETLDALHSEMPGGQERHLGVALDLELADSPRHLREVTCGHFGRPDILVHNLGGSLGVTETLCAAADWARVWNFNVGIAHELNRLFIPDMVAGKWGRILHLSTLSTQTHEGHPAYVSAKCALDGYVRSMSRRLSKDNVVMSALAPGLVDLNGRHFNRVLREDPASMEQYYDHHLPIRRMAGAGEIAAIATFLCSEQAAYMPGSIVRADGGGK